MNMSFGRLLAAGRSLVGLSNGESRYREDKHARLPKFISPKNPFAPAEKSNTPAVPAATAGVVAVPAEAEKPNTLTAQTISPNGQRTGWLGGLRLKMNPFGNRGSVAKPANAGPRQGELALERVQVMRNDLSDAECKAGPPQPKLILPALPVMTVTMEKLEPVGAAWSRLTAKFMGTDQT
jgi:hypothetical protein